MIKKEEGHEALRLGRSGLRGASAGVDIGILHWNGVLGAI